MENFVLHQSFHGNH